MSNLVRLLIVVTAGIFPLVGQAVQPWAPTGPMATARGQVAAVVLPDGRVMATGGATATEIFDPLNGTWSAGAAMHDSRVGHTLTILRDGRILAAGGTGLSSAEIYDPWSATWKPTGSMSMARAGHTATLLPDGRVLVAGDQNPSTAAETYDPLSGRWQAAQPMKSARASHTATRLQDGRVLVAGGNAPTTNVEIYDANAGNWTAGGAIADAARKAHGALLLSDGRVLLVSGGTNTCEVYDPRTGLSTLLTNSLPRAYSSPQAVVLPSGAVLLTGDGGSGGPTSLLLSDVNAAWVQLGELSASRSNHAMVLLPTGLLLAAGGTGGQGSLNSADIYTPQGIWTKGPAVPQAVDGLGSATLLLSGQVLFPSSNGVQIADPASGSWTSAASDGRFNFFGTVLLPSGVVFRPGNGWPNGFLFDPVTRTSTLTPGMTDAVMTVTALLPDGEVMMAGGLSDGLTLLDVAQVYSPAANSWRTVGSMPFAPQEHAGVMLPGGKVLVTGGDVVGANAIADATLYDPACSCWSSVAPMKVTRFQHTLTLLPNGTVLAVGGENNDFGLNASAEVFDPQNNTWTLVGSMSEPRFGPQALLLNSGLVLVVGGQSGAFIDQASAELYNPATKAWTPAGSASTARGEANQNVVLPDGRVFSVSQQASDFYDPSAAAAAGVTPVITGLSAVVRGQAVGLEGYGLLGSQPQSAVPVLRVQRIDNGQSLFVPADPLVGFSDTAFTSLPLPPIDPGPAIVTLLVNGRFAAGRVVVIE